MKVILLEDVKGTGKKGDIIEAKDGHANNFLLPKKLAMPANKQNMQALEREKEYILKQKANALTEAKKLAEALEGKEYVVSVKAGANGKLFGAVTNKEIAAAVEAAAGVHIDRKKIELHEPLKNVGSHDVVVRLHHEVEAKINVILKANGE